MHPGMTSRWPWVVCTNCLRICNSVIPCSEGKPTPQRFMKRPTASRADDCCRCIFIKGYAMSSFIPSSCSCNQLRSLMS
jgi:hypothetical protein